MVPLSPNLSDSQASSDPGSLGSLQKLSLSVFPLDNCFDFPPFFLIPEVTDYKGSQSTKVPGRDMISIGSIITIYH